LRRACRAGCPNFSVHISRHTSAYQEWALMVGLQLWSTASSLHSTWSAWRVEHSHKICMLWCTCANCR
jgi:hypothetical protein